MKIATRIALLQWQANPADPANLWRLIIALVTPGMREPGDQGPVLVEYPLNKTSSKKIDRESDLDKTFRKGTVVTFLVGFVCGGVVLWAVQSFMPKTDEIEKVATEMCSQGPPLLTEEARASCIRRMALHIRYERAKAR